MRYTVMKALQFLIILPAVTLTQFTTSSYAPTITQEPFRIHPHFRLIWDIRSWIRESALMSQFDRQSAYPTYQSEWREQVVDDFVLWLQVQGIRVQQSVAAYANPDQLADLDWDQQTLVELRLYSIDSGLLGFCGPFPSDSPSTMVQVVNEFHAGNIAPAYQGRRRMALGIASRDDILNWVQSAAVELFDESNRPEIDLNSYLEVVRSGCRGFIAGEVEAPGGKVLVLIYSTISPLRIGDF